MYRNENPISCFLEFLVSLKSLIENPHLDPDKYKNYLLTCWCPLELKSRKDDGTESIIWVNDSPNSISYTRPLSLMRASKSRDVIEAEFSGLFKDMMETKDKVK